MDLLSRRTLFNTGRAQLQGAVTNNYIETLTLLSFVLKISPVQLVTHFEKKISAAEKCLFEKYVSRRRAGEPLAYLTEYCEFWSLPFKVTPDCLIPRPDTETLIENILAYHSSTSTVRVLELGTGSGAIAISLKKERPNWQIIATDQSQKALEIAQYNAQRLHSRIEFRRGDWWAAVSKNELFDIIISNPPYLSRTDKHLVSLRYEPSDALVGGLKGTEVLRMLIENAKHYLTPKGRLWVEQGFDQANIVYSYFQQEQYTDICQHQDLGGLIRISSGSKPDCC